MRVVDVQPAAIGEDDVGQAQVLVGQLGGVRGLAGEIEPPGIPERVLLEISKQIMAPGALDPLTKEMIYVAVSVTNQCGYCIASHTVSAQKKGMTDAMFKELMAVVGMANETNRLVAGYQVEIDPQFKSNK